MSDQLRKISIGQDVKSNYGSTAKNNLSNIKLQQEVVKLETLDLDLHNNNSNNGIPQPGDPNFIGPLPKDFVKPNDPISGPFTKPDTDGPIKIYDDGNITHTFKHKNPVEVSNGNYDDTYNDLGKVSFEDCIEIEIPVERCNPLEMNNTCDTLSGSCENEKYRIIAYKSGDDSKQRIKIYDKSTNEIVNEFTTNKLGHANGLTIDGDTVYVANCEKKDDYTKVSHFSLNDALNDNENIESETFQVMVNGKVIDEGISGISHDAINNDTCVTAAGNDIYISKGDGTYLHTTKMIVSDEEKANGIAGTTQDICVANDKMYVIRTKDPKSMGRSNIDEGCNMIDIYDTNGKYIGSKTIDLPGNHLTFGKDDTMSSDKQYRELESISYDSNTDSFTLYFTSPDYLTNKLLGNNTAPPHMVVTGVKFGV